MSLSNSVGERPVRPVCGAEGCDRPHEARGYCFMHYDRLRRTGDVQADRPKQKPAGRERLFDGCQVPGCDRPHIARGFCSRHYMQERARNGGTWRTAPQSRSQRWTPERVALLDQMLEEGRPRAEIADALNTTETAIRQAVAQIPLLRHERERHLTLQATMDLMGVSRAVLLGWISNGWLRAVGTSPYRYVRRVDLVAFLSRPAHWHRWDPDQITNAALRAGALRVREKGGEA